MFKKVIACLLCLILFLSLAFFFGGGTYAADFEIPKATDAQINEAVQKIVPLRFLPGHPLYLLISLKEGLNKFFQPSSAKRAKFISVLSGKRLKETYLLIENSKRDEAYQNLVRYEAVNNELIDQLKRARGQNQEVTPLSLEIAEDFKNHEILLYGILSLLQIPESGVAEEFDRGVRSFIEVVFAINEIKPGLKDRFKTVISLEDKPINDPLVTEATAGSSLMQATPSVRPRRIIY